MARAVARAVGTMLYHAMLCCPMSQRRHAEGARAPRRQAYIYIYIYICICIYIYIYISVTFGLLSQSRASSFTL